MARIEPFRGLRPGKKFVDEVVSPPYDVLTSKEAKELAKGKEYSFLHIVKPEIDLADEVNVYSDIVYEKAKKNFNKFIKDKILFQDEKKCFYLYKQTWGEHVQTGLVAGASAQDYQDDIIKKHELTREVKENDRMKHIEALNANTGPVFLTFRQNDKVLSIFERCMQKQPEYDFSSRDGVRHIFYLIDSKNLIEEIKSAFKEIPYLYVADGHHRSAAGTNIKIKRQKKNPRHTGDEEYNFFLSVIFPHTQMKILAYNRVVKDIGGRCKAEFFLQLSNNFHYRETDKTIPEKNHEFCMNIDGKWYLLTAREGSFNKNDTVESLDVSILQKNLLDPVLGIKDPRKDERIGFVGGIRGTKELEKLIAGGEYKVAFCLLPNNI